MVAQLLSSDARPATLPPVPTPALPNDPLADWYLRLLSNAVSRDLADRIVADARRRLPSGAADETAVRDAFRECIASHIRAAHHPVHLPAPGEPRPRAITLVGATGVGKTTTIAKLAAQAKLNQRASVGVITCDTNRIGAIEQLRTYADIVGAAFHVAGTPAEMRDARRTFADADLLLIDTPGLSPRDSTAIEALRSILDAADLSEVHLALPASGSETSLLAACRAFAPLNPSRLLFTKMDEAVTYGVILSVASQVRAELSYLTSGPRIPEQIELPDPYRLADLIAAA
jgi:flagellar biosynthesis protein FlhF